MTIMTPHSYSAYKPSGVEWLGDVPAHWEVRRIGTIAQILNGATPSTSNASYWDGDIVWITPDDLGKLNGRYVTGSGRRITEEGYKACGTNLAPAGSIAISTRAPIGHLGVLRSDACVNQGCRLLVPDDAVETEFLHYALSTTTSTLASFGQGSTFTELSRTLLAAFQLPLPPLPEQRAIVRYLDYVDRRIRRYVAAKRKLIALLEEERQAIVNRAVTRGLDPNVRLKPSGVEWLGDVPEHWEVVPFKRRIGFQEGPGIMAADFRDSGVPLLRISCLRGPVATLDGCNYLDPDVVRARWSHFAINEADYLLSASASTGAVSLATSKVVGCVPYTGIIRLWSASPRTVMPYVRLFLSSRLFLDQVDLEKTGVAISHFGPTHLSRMVITLPPEPEQQAIVEYMDKATAGIDAAIARARRQVELVEEYRTRLIADVVTGKLDVREAASQLPDEDSEAEPIGENGPLADGQPGDLYSIDESVEDSVMEEEVTA